MLDPDFTAKACPAGSALPDCHVKVIETGVGAKTAVCPKTENPASAMQASSRVFTYELSAHRPASVSTPRMRGVRYFPAAAFSVTTGDGSLDPAGPVNSSLVPSS